MNSSSVKFLKYTGLIIIDADEYELFNLLQDNHEIRSCIKHISKDKKIQIDLPKTEVADDELMQWHLKRINKRDLPLPEKFTRNDVGECVTHTYIIDSGIDGSHPDFEGRLAPKYQHESFVNKDICCKNYKDPLCDCSSHGTHCAGLVASPNAGYNPKTILHSMKVFDYTGSTSKSTVIEAMEATIESKKAYHDEAITIASMSIGGSQEDYEDQVADRMVENGIFLAVAAGNSSIDACTSSPAAAKKAFTVGASDINDNRAFFSNYGKCVDGFAPGHQIYSTLPGGKYGYKSGTSMATPFLAGFATYVACDIQSADPDKIFKEVIKRSTKDIIQNSLTQNNYLPYDGKDDK